MAKKQHKWYVLSSGEVNRYGYRIVVGEGSTDGIHTDAYEINSVLLVIHDGKKLSVGKLEIKKEDGVLYGRPTFDVKDPIGKELNRKYHEGFMSAFSITHDPKKTSDTDLVPGQTRATILECDLYEVSVVNVPGDRFAAGLRLDADQTIDDVLPKLNFENHSKSKEKEMNKLSTAIISALALGADATEEMALSAINKLKAVGAEALTAKVDTLMALGVEKGVVTEENKSTYEALAASDFASTKTLIESAVTTKATDDTSEQSLSAQIEATKQANAKLDKPGTEETFESLSKTTAGQMKLSAMKKDDPEAYTKLAAGYGKSV